MCSFVGAAVRGDAAAAAAVLTPPIEAVLWQDWQWTEVVAEGGVLLGDVAGVEKWLGRSVDLGMGYLANYAHQHALWKPWRDHPRIAPLMARCREYAARYAAIPLAPRLATLVSAAN